MVEPGAALGGAKLLYLLRRLATTGDVLHLGAHPDDEDGGLIAFVSHRYDARIVYWSATRGESGQNRVGPYLGEELGVYRTWEALAARQIDDGESIYGPFIDYGYSKTAREVLEKWGEEALVREMVRAIRWIQPQIVISRWRGDASDGHGQHAAAGAALLEAYGAAGDPERFPELARVGLAPWEPRRLLQVMTGDWQPGEHVEVGVERAEFEAEGYLRLNTGAYDPITGLTYEEQAALAFNQYLTQATGSVPRPGDYYRYLRVVHSAGDADGGGRDLFAGLDRTLTSLAEYPGGGSEPLRTELQALNELMAGVVGDFKLDAPAQSTSGLLELVRRLRRLVHDLPSFGLDTSAQRALARYLERKRTHAQTAAAACLGLRVDASVDAARLTPGDRVRLRCRLWAYGPEPPAKVEFRPELRLEGAAATRVDSGDDASAVEFELQVPPDAPLSTPYWLRTPREPYRYVWPEEPFVGAPFDPPLLAVGCHVEIGGDRLELESAAAQREAFVGGERRPAEECVRAGDDGVVVGEGVEQILVAQHLDGEAEAAQDGGHRVAGRGGVRVAEAFLDGGRDDVDVHRRRPRDELLADARPLVRLAAEPRGGLPHGRDGRVVAPPERLDHVADLVRARRRVRRHRHRHREARDVPGPLERDRDRVRLRRPARRNVDRERPLDRRHGVVPDDLDAQAQLLRLAPLA